MTTAPTIILRDGTHVPTFPANAVVMPILIGDSTAVGWESQLADVRWTLPGGATLTDCTLWDKWTDTTQLTHADTGTGWDPVTDRLGRNAATGTGAPGAGTFMSPAYGIAYYLRERVRPLMQTPDVRLVKMAATSTGFHESYTNAAACWSPRRSGATMYVLFEQYYLKPAINNLLAAGKRVFLDGIYCLGGGNDGVAGGTGGYPPINSLAASWKTLRETIGMRVGLRSMPWRFARTVSFTNTIYTEIPKVQAQQDIFAQTGGVTMVLADDIERITDGLHFTGQGTLELGLRIGAAAGPGYFQEITQAPA